MQKLKKIKCKNYDKNYNKNNSNNNNIQGEETGCLAALPTRHSCQIG